MGELAADEAVVDAVLLASRALIAIATQSLGQAAEDTTLAQYRALVVLASRGPQRMSDLSQALGVAPSTAGRMCDRLVRKGLARRQRDRADRRARCARSRQRPAKCPTTCGRPRPVMRR
jgi:DNA-binding MarR family transcriptional regulator